MPGNYFLDAGGRRGKREPPGAAAGRRGNEQGVYGLTVAL
jgi:hypothetical protein